MIAAAHPREVFDYDGGDYDGGQGAEAAFLDSLDRGRLHHAWLLCGPEGVGKATFAYRAARRLLGARPSPDHGLLGAAPDDPVCRQIAARAHPDLMVLELASEDGKPRKSIPVDEARRLPEFFSKAPGQAQYRVAIIDAADDLNLNAANAVLKTLEEPPQRGVLLLVAHAPGRLLPTIRSRCRRLEFPAWDPDRTVDFLAQRMGLAPEDAARLARMSGGAPGKAVTLAQEGALQVDRAAHDILRRLPMTDDAALLALADGFRGAEGARRFNLLFERLAAQVRDMAVATAGKDPSSAPDRWVQVWERLCALPVHAEAVNLDRADVFWTVMAELRAAANG